MHKKHDKIDHIVVLCMYGVVDVMISLEQQTLAPLIDSLLMRLDEAGQFMRLPMPTHLDSFVSWYLEVIQLLESHVAAHDAHPPMQRKEVELMCRLAATATNLREAIDIVAAYSVALHPRAGEQLLVVEGDAAEFRLRSLRSRHTSISRVVDITGLHAFYQLFSWLIGKSLPLQRVGVVDGARSELLPFLVLFDAPALEESDAYSLRFDADVFNTPVMRTRGELQAFLDEYPCRILGVDSGSTTRQQVLALLGAATQQESPLPGLKQLAAVLGVSEITLRRRLKQEGTSYRELKDACLVEAARYHLQQRRRSIEEIAGVLGFADATAFRRSFKRCTGMAPSLARC